MERRLYRSRSDRMIWGVCGGLAKYLDIDPVIVRVIMVLLVFANGISILAYIIMAIVVPLEGSRTAEIKETMRENVEEMKESAVELGEEIRSTFGGEEVEAEERDKIHQRRRNFIGIILIVVGFLFLAANFNFFWWFHWDRLWPLLLVVVGLLIILSAWRRRHD